MAATVVALSAIASTVAGCAPRPPVSAPPSFALTSADVVFTSGEPYPVNLIFVAAEKDPIWTALSGVKLPGDASVGPGEFDVIRGEGSGGYLLGNITFEIDIPPDGLRFHSVGLVFDTKTEPSRVEVGSWTLTEAPPQEFATTEAKGEVTAMSRCGGVDLPVPPALSSVTAFHTGSDLVTAQEVAPEPRDGAIHVDLTCTGDADFSIISPTLDYIDLHRAARRTRLAPITIGLQDIDEEDLQRIRAR